jgi:hypothetical protein
MWKDIDAVPRFCCDNQEPAHHDESTATEPSNADNEEVSDRPMQYH